MHILQPLSSPVTVYLNLNVVTSAPAAGGSNVAVLSCVFSASSEKLSVKLLSSTFTGSSAMTSNVITSPVLNSGTVLAKRGRSAGVISVIAPAGARKADVLVPSVAVVSIGQHSLQSGMAPTNFNLITPSAFAPATSIASVGSEPQSPFVTAESSASIVYCVPPLMYG
jgi:hypothetical protein